MHDIWWNLKQDSAIKQANINANASNASANSARQNSRDVEARLEKLSLVCQAMWTLLLERTDLTEQDLQQRVTDLDMADGVLDGKVTKPVVKCKKCNSAISHQFSRCLFCGEDAEDGSAWASI